jgi:hypothetical protein
VPKLSACILRLRGVAGCSKFRIARSVAARLQKLQRLGSLYCCDYENRDLKYLANSESVVYFHIRPLTVGKVAQFSILRRLSFIFFHVSIEHAYWAELPPPLRGIPFAVVAIGASVVATSRKWPTKLILDQFMTIIPNIWFVTTAYVM